MQTPLDIQPKPTGHCEQKICLTKRLRVPSYIRMQASIANLVTWCSKTITLLKIHLPAPPPIKTSPNAHVPMATRIVDANGYRPGIGNRPIWLCARSTQALQSGKGYCPERADLRLPLQRLPGIAPWTASCSWFLEHVRAKGAMLNVLEICKRL